MRRGMAAKSLLLSRKKSAPASKAATLRAGTAWLVRTTMQAAWSGAAARNRRITPKPVPCASCKSTMARSMLKRSQAASASSSVAAVATTATRSGTETSSTRRSAICGESSTTRALMSSSSCVWASMSSGTRGFCPGPPSRAAVAAWLRIRPEKSSPAYSGDMSRCMLGDELILHRIVSDVRVRLEVHFFENARTISAHRLDAEEELLRDFRHALPCGELAENLEFALRKLRMRRLVGGMAREALRELVGDARAHVAPSLRRSDHGRHEVFRRRILRDEARSARLQQVDRVLILGIAAHDEHRHLGTNRLAAIQYVDTGHVGERQVHECDVEGIRTDEIDGLFAGARFGGDFHVHAPREDLLDAHSHDIVIIDDQQPDHGSRLLYESHYSTSLSVGSVGENGFACRRNPTPSYSKYPC